MSTVTALHDLDTLMLELNCQVTANLKRELLTQSTAQLRIEMLEQMCEYQLYYDNYFMVLPEEQRLDPITAQLAMKLQGVTVSAQHFAKYLAAVCIDPLLKTELSLEIA